MYGTVTGQSLKCFVQNEWYKVVGFRQYKTLWREWQLNNSSTKELLYVNTQNNPPTFCGSERQPIWRTTESSKEYAGSNPSPDKNCRSDAVIKLSVLLCCPLLYCLDPLRSLLFCSLMFFRCLRNDDAELLCCKVS